MYADADAAALYDLLNPWGPSDDFYLSYVMDAPSVLDVGCGTGTLLHRARECGHTGRLCGLDPDVAALDRARLHERRHHRRRARGLVGGRRSGAQVGTRWRRRNSSVSDQAASACSGAYWRASALAKECSVPGQVRTSTWVPWSRR
jgi:SAM-dependent methyltransferase